MIRRYAFSLVFLSVVSGCSMTNVRRPPPAGLIATDSGGAIGYQHGIERSQFIVGKYRRLTSEFGFVKLVGSEGSFAVDAANGAVIAIPNARSTEQKKNVWYTFGYEKHNDQVIAYFVAAGVPKDQIGGVHATMSLYASGGEREASAAQPKIAGWQSVLKRMVNGVPVIDSVGWARMNDQGKVLTEWVYWPPIPAKVIEDTRRLRARLSQDPDRAAFLSRLPPNLPPGNLVIRHSSATANGPFEVFASYDVVEHKTLADSTSRPNAGRVRVASIVRHFDVEGNERKLPQERRGPDGDFPTEKRPPSSR